MEPIPFALIQAESSPAARTLIPSETSLAASAGGALGKLQGPACKGCRIGRY